MLDLMLFMVSPNPQSYSMLLGIGNFPTTYDVSPGRLAGDSQDLLG